jgi:hypothetical protein
MAKPLIDEVFEKAGGRKALQEALSVGRERPLSKQTLSDWVREGVVPVRHCPAVHRLTGIPLERLNPAFDPEPSKHSDKPSTRKGN